MKFRNSWWIGLLGAASAIAVEPPKTEPPTEPPTLSSEDLYQSGKELFETFAPAEIKAQFEFPEKSQWDEFAVRLQRALESNDLSGLAQFEFEARAVLMVLRTVPGNEAYIDWLEERLDYIEAAKQSTLLPVPVSPVVPSFPPVPENRAQAIPYFDLWLERLQKRPVPAAADRYVPMLGAIFAAAGLPAELVWLVEVESTFNPAAGSPAGARGLFQLMPATAKELGLSTFLPDERSDPAKSAEAAAQLLIRLHKKFGDWPLALAAYNAGAGRVQRTLNQQKASSFADIAAALPAETRMYVPKVLAMLQVRAGKSLAALAPPRS